MARKILELIGLLSVMFVFIVGLLYVPDFFMLPGHNISISGPIANSDVLDVLSIVMAFIGAAGYAVYRWVSRAINDEMQTRLAQERIYINANIHVVLSILHWQMYTTLYESATSSTDDKGRNAQKSIEETIAESEYVMREFSQLDAARFHLEDIVNNNNYAYYLALRWNYYRESMSDSEFESLLISLGKIRDYIADKRLAEKCIGQMLNAKQIPNKKREREIITSFEDTKEFVQKVFSLEPSSTK